jgi:flagellin
MSILNNISSLQTQNQMNTTSTALQQVLQQLSTGSRLNSGADDPAALAIANGLQANTAALTQSAMNASDGVGKLQVADGALSQVTTLLNTAITLATEASNGTVSSAQQASMDNEFTSIKAEITRIGSSTTYNGAAVFSGVTSQVFLSDGTTAGSSTIDATVGTLSASSIGFSAAAGGGAPINLSTDNLTSVATAQAALTDITAAIANVAGDRAQVGADTNRLQSATNVVNTQVQNLTSAYDNISSANIAQDVSEMSQYNILNSTGMAALQQSNQSQQAILKLLQ